MDGVVKAHDIVLEGSSSRGYHALEAHVLSDLLNNSRGLESKLSGWDEHEDLDLVLARVSLLKAGDDVCRGFPGSVLGPREDVTVLKDDGDSCWESAR